MFAAPELRPPVYDEMVRDMENIIHKVVAPYVSQGCVELHFEDLVSECWAKTTRMNQEGLLHRSKTRSEYFAQYKTAIANHVCSLVQKHVYTEKRTGVKAPPKDKRHLPEHAHNTRAVEVRIDDPDANHQVADLECGDDSADFRQLFEHVASYLNYMEQGVLQQLLSPNEEALFYARQDAEIGRQPGEPLQIRIRQEHLARGIGVSPDLFRQTHEAIKQKCFFMKNPQQEEDPRHTAAMVVLTEFFDVQIPRSIDHTTRKRAIMIAARVQYDRVKDNEGIKEAMDICEIPFPEVRNDRFNCFGVMFQKHHRTCENCGIRQACELKAANFGLGEITISHRLLGARHTRVPVIRPNRMLASALGDEREEEIMAFLDENFRRVTQQEGVAHYRHKDRTAAPGVGNEQMIFAIEGVSPLRLRFISPAAELKDSLKAESSEKGGRRSYYLPETINATEAVNLLRAHAQVTFTKTMDQR